MQLRPHQINAINNVYSAIEDGHNKIVLAATTSFGKTVVAAKLCLDVVALNKKVLVLVHLEPLINQTNEKLWSVGLRPGFIKAGYEENFDADIQIASVQTLAQRDNWKHLDFGMILIDECHTTMFYQATKDLMELYPSAIFIGLTATPKRLGKEQLGDYFDILISTPTPTELTEKGYLVPLRYFRPDSADTPDLSAVSIKGEDYDEAELRNACDRDELIIAAVRDWLRLCPGKKTLAFCVDVRHAERVSKAFNTVGVPSECVTGETPTKEREAIYARLKSGETLVLTSVNVLAIGFDEPSVEVGLMLRPTMSEALYLQMIGRIMRIFTGKEFGIILDQAGNSTRLINPEDITGYELPYSKPKANGIAPTKVCPSCDRRNYNFVKDCACGFHWATTVEINDSVMIEVTPGKVVSGKEVREQFQGFRKDSLLRREPPIIAEKRFATIYNFAPPKEWYNHSIFGGVLSRENIDYFMEYLLGMAKKSDQDEAWVCEQLVMEFGEKIEELIAA